MADVVLTGLASNDPLPGDYIEINFAQGPASGANVQRPVLLMGNKLAAGSATVDTVLYGPDTPTPCTNEADVIALFGRGSELHRMYKRFVAVNKVTAVYMIAVTASAGTAATGTIVVTGTATSNGAIRVFVGDEFVDAPVASGDLQNAIATNVAAYINKMVDWPVTAAANTNTVTLTARTAGPRGNAIRYMAQTILLSGTTITATADGALSGGATEDSNTTALTTIAAKFFYYIATAALDTTQIGALCAQVDSQAAPTTGLRQRVIAGSVDTNTNAQTIAIARNLARAEMIWSYKSPWTPAELAANAAAVYSLMELGDNPETNFAFFGEDPRTQALWKVPAPRDVTAHPTRAQLVSCLNNGVTPIAVRATGRTYLVKRVTTRSLLGAQNDYRIRDSHKVTVCDYFADEALSRIRTRLGGKRLKDSPPKGAPQVGPRTVTPDIARLVLRGLVDDFDARELIQEADLTKQEMIVQRAAVNRSRIEGRVPLRPIDNFEQSAFAIDQVA